MALATYADLKNRVADWMERADLGSAIDDYVTLFEAWANRKLRVRQMEAVTLLITSSGTATLPADYLAYRSVTWNGDPPRELGYAEPTWYRAWFDVNFGNDGDLDDDDINIIGVPTMFTIEGSVFRCFPVDDSDNVTLRYWQLIPALSGTVNWLYQAYPDLYLYGTLVEAAGYESNPDKLAFWKSRRDEILREITILNSFTTGGTGGPMRPMGWIA